MHEFKKERMAAGTKGNIVEAEMSRIGNVLESYPSCKLQVRLPQFHGSGRRHNSPGLEMKDSLLLRAVSVARASAFCAGSLGPSSTG